MVAGELRVFTLGTLDFRLAAKPLTSLGSRKAEALLLYLVMQRRAVPRQTLATLLWPQLSEHRALANLSVVLTALRREVGGFLDISPRAIGLRAASSVWVDALALEKQVGESRGQAEGPDASGAAALAEALALYRGDFLAGFSLRGAPEFEAWALLQREHLRRLALEGMSRLARHHMRRGDFGQALRWARQGLHLDPLDEETHRLVMLAHARRGEWAQALAAYKTCAAELRKELDVDPGYRTRALRERIRAASSERRTNLPPIPRLVDRERELGEIAARLADPDCRLLTIVGPAGVGKSHLALEAARRAGEAFLNGVFLVRLDALDYGAQVASATATALGIESYRGGTIEDQVIDHLRDREVLLLLDSAEHVAGEMTFLARLLEVAQDLKVLVTSQRRLGLHAEWVLELGGLAYPGQGEEPHAVEACRRFPAVALYVQAARRVAPDFVLEARNVASVARICALVEGFPLGLELAAAWERGLSSEEIARQLEASAEWLRSNRADVPPRHQSMQAVFEYTWGLLSEPERAALRALAVFRSAFTREAAYQVAGVTQQALLSLRDRSVLRPADSGGYRLHALLRTFAARQLAQTGPEETRLRARHAAFYLSRLAEWEDCLQAGTEREALSALEACVEDALQAWEWALVHGPWDSLILAGRVFLRFYDVRGLYREGLERFASACRVLEAGSGPADGERRRLLSNLCAWRGTLSLSCGEYQSARQMFLEARAGFEALKDEQGLAACDLGLAGVASYAGDPQEAIEAYSAALRRYTALGDIAGQASAHNGLGVIHYRCAAYAQAREHFEESARLRRRLGDRQGEARTRMNLGNIAFRLGEYERAESILQEALQAFREVGDTAGVSRALNNLGNVAQHLGDLERTEAHFRESLDLKQRLGDRKGIANSLGNLGIVATQRGEFARARQFRHDALRLQREIGNLWGAANELNGLGFIARSLDELHTAEKLHKEALRTAMEARAMAPLDEALLGLADLRRRTGDVTGAYLLAAFVRGRPVSDRAVQQQAEGLCHELSAELSAGAQREVERQLMGRTLESVVTMALEMPIVRSGSARAGADPPSPQPG